MRIVRWLIFVIVAVALFSPEKSRTSNATLLASDFAAQKNTTQDRIFDRDDGSGLSFEEDKPRMDQFARNLIRVSNSKGYVIVYGGQKGPPNEARIRISCIRKYLSRSYQNKIGKDRLVLINGGYRVEVSVELFVLLPGDAIPEPQPTISPEAVRVVKSRKHARPCK